MTSNSDEDVNSEKNLNPNNSGDIECPVCLQIAVNPTKLPCGHVFCFLCLKGVVNISHRCALCRREATRDAVDRPELVYGVNSVKNIKPLEDGFQWFYEGRNGWWQYDERTSNEIETAYKAHQKSCNIFVAGFIYIVDFDTMMQRRQNDPGKKRKVKRDLAEVPKKGIAGIRLQGETSNFPLASTSSANNFGQQTIITPITPITPNTPTPPPPAPAGSTPSTPNTFLGFLSAPMNYFPFFGQPNQTTPIDLTNGTSFAGQAGNSGLNNIYQSNSFGQPGSSQLNNGTIEVDESDGIDDDESDGIDGDDNDREESDEEDEDNDDENVIEYATFPSQNHFLGETRVLRDLERLSLNRGDHHIADPEEEENNFDPRRYRNYHNNSNNREHAV